MLPLNLHNKGGQYYHRLRGLFSSSIIAYWPLWETSGAVAYDISGHGLHGSYSGSPALGTVPAVKGVAPQFDGVDDYADLLTAGLIAAFNGDEGTLFLQAKLADAEFINAAYERIITLTGAVSENTNSIRLYQTLTDYQLSLSMTSGGVGKGATLNDVSTEKWLTYAITWSASNDRVRAYLCGEQHTPSGVGLGAWAGPVSVFRVAIVGITEAKCAVSHVLLLNREATPTEIRSYSAIFGATKVLTTLGDSITAHNQSSPWSIKTIFEYGGGNKMTLKNRAVSGASIIASMDAQVVSAANDNADIIIIALGTGDNGGGDMGVLQAEAEENIIELKASNPRAVLYWLNVLPRWTDAVGGPEVDRANIRTAIAAACTAQGITCWDTYTVPWITQAQTADGLHPTAAGHTAIAAEVLARI